MNPLLYGKIYIYSVIILTLIVCINVQNKSYCDFEKKNINATLFAFVISIIYALWLGNRPATYEFSDTGNYAHTFSQMADGVYTIVPEVKDATWMYFMNWCAQIMDINMYLTLISIGYFAFSLWACIRFTSNNTLISLLFLFGSLSFYSYGTNGIRNGLACAIVLVSLSYLIGNKKDFIVGLALALLAINVHRTTLLPLGMSIVSLFLIRNFKWALIFWILSIFISLIAGNLITEYFASLGFDDRLSYLTSTENEEKFSHTGFRWDFLLYSFMPILLGYYIVIKRNIQDNTFNFLLNTYTLANALWIMVIRAEYSNRFAYLSWFMYPLVLAYPLLKVDVWGEIQGKRLQQIMLAQVGFTWFMETFVW